MPAILRRNVIGDRGIPRIDRSKTARLMRQGFVVKSDSGLAAYCELDRAIIVPSFHFKIIDFVLEIGQFWSL
jgi:hypothetical protein